MNEKVENHYQVETRLFDLLQTRLIKSDDYNSSIETFKKKEYIYLQGEPSEFLFLIISGRVKIGYYDSNKREILKDVLSEEDIFGEHSLIGEKKLRSFAKAIDENTRICSFPAIKLKEMMNRDQILTLAVTEFIGTKLNFLEKKLESLMHKDTRSRIVSFLKDLAEDKGKEVGFEIVIHGHFTHQDIGLLTRTSRQGVTTVFNELRAKQIITYNNRRILIRSMNALSNYLKSNSLG